MLSLPLRCLCVATALLATLLARAGEIPPSVVWRLDDLASLGGAKTEIWGAPSRAKEGSGSSVRFDGKADGLVVPVIPISEWKAFTIEICFSVDADGQPEQRFLHLQDEKGRRVLIELRLLPGGQWCLDTFLYSDAAHRLTLIDRAKAHQVGRWHWAALTYADGRMTHFVDGVRECEGAIQFEPMSATGRTSLGVRQNKVSWFKGAIREVRFTPEARPAEKLQRAPKD
ncbi:LamG domain-containing protein [Nibricoccus aquaticus]|nr:LamG domain-containing protein [Nibricoccus aquaticus]